MEQHAFTQLSNGPKEGSIEGFTKKSFRHK